MLIHDSKVVIDRLKDKGEKKMEKKENKKVKDKK